MSGRIILSSIQNRRKPLQRIPFPLFFFFFFLHLLLPSNLLAQEKETVLAESTDTVITAESIEYLSGTRQYVARGAVEIKQDDAVINADEIIYSEVSGDVSAQGKVHYEDTDSSIRADKAELNLERKTGKLFNAHILYKKDNYHLFGTEIEKTGENTYFSPSAAFTTCDAPVPAWCFQGKNVDVVLGERVKARDTTFRIKNVPVLYSPYLWVPVMTERQTGLLMPSVTQSESRGFGLNLPFFWAISENRDATFVLDSYSRRGIGKGIEYRFIEPGGVRGNWWAYHIRDRELKKNFWELKGIYENRFADGTGGFLNINLLNEKEFYREFSTRIETRSQRFLESAGELNFQMQNSRVYLLSQYWIDLKNETSAVPQKLPEAGYVLNYSRFGSFLFSNSFTAANIWRDKGISAARADLYPNLLHSAGKDFVVSQRAALRATVYSLYRDDSLGRSLERTAFEYDVTGHTRLYRRYDSFLHIIEPSLSYHYIAASENDLPVFDVSELFRKRSRFELALLNRIMAGGNEIGIVRLSQGMETHDGDRPFQPLRLEAALSRWVPLRLDASYNVHSGRLETVQSDLSLSLFSSNISFGQSYNRVEDIMLFRAGLDFSPFRGTHVNSSIWYNPNAGGVRDMRVAVNYQRQCWGLNFQVIKQPNDFTFLVMFRLVGLNMEPRRIGAR
jgi:LPS-assembly protein